MQDSLYAEHTSTNVQAGLADKTGQPRKLH